MSEHDDLSRRVALAVGWTEITPDGGRGEYIMGARWWGVAGVPPSWFSAGDYARPEVPDYEHDADACIDALDATGRTWNIMRHVAYLDLPESYHCMIYAIEGDGDPQVFQRGHTICEAMCYALLAWTKERAT